MGAKSSKTAPKPLTSVPKVLKKVVQRNKVLPATPLSQLTRSETASNLCEGSLQIIDLEEDGLDGDSEMASFQPYMNDSNDFYTEVCKIFLC